MKNVAQVGLILLWLIPAACAETGAATPIETAVPAALAAAVPVMECPVYGRCSLRPVDPLTGADIAGYRPLSLGQYTAYAFSPDRSLLAITLRPTPQNPNAELHLIDLAAWQVIPTGVQVTGWTLNNLLAFSPNGQRLALTVDTQPDGSQLAVVDLATRTVTAHTQLDFVPWLLAFSPDGEALLAYGSTYEGQPRPQAALFNAGDLSDAWAPPLRGVRDGEYPLATGDDATEERQWMRPAVALSPDRRYLYLVHADEERLTTVDFVARAVATTELRLARPWFERLLDLTAGVARAKAANLTGKQAVLSADGARLYVITTAYRSGEAGGQEPEFQTAVVQVVDPASGAVLAQTEAEPSTIALSPDGRRLYLNGWQETGRVKILGAAGLVEERALGQWNLWPAYRLDGQPVLIGFNLGREDAVEAAAFDPVTLTPGPPFTGTVLTLGD